MKQEIFKKFIFFERSGRRWKFSKISFFVLLLILLIFLFFIVKGLVDKPVLKAIEISNSKVEPINQPLPSDGKEFSLVSLSINEEISSETFVFYQSKDHPNGENKSSLTQNIDLIDVLIPDWFYLNESAMIVEKNDSNIDKLGKENGVKIIPQISLDRDSNAGTVHEWLSSPETKRK